MTKALAGSIQFGCGSHAQFDDGHSALGDIIFLSSSDLQDIDSLLSYQVPDLFISPWLSSLPSTCPANPSQAQQPMYTWPTAVLRGQQLAWRSISTWVIILAFRSVLPRVNL